MRALTASISLDVGYQYRIVTFSIDFTSFEFSSKIIGSKEYSIDLGHTKRYISVKGRSDMYFASYSDNITLYRINAFCPDFIEVHSKYVISLNHSISSAFG